MGAARGLRAALAEMPAVDHHAHVLATAGHEPVLARVLCETNDAVQLDQVPYTATYHRALRALAAFAGTEPDEEALTKRREELGADEWSRRLLAASRLAGVFVDDGFVFPGSGTVDQLASLAGCPVQRVVRLESAAEAVVDGSSDLDEAREYFRAGVREGLDRGAVALKTVAAYRCGLDLGPPEPDAVAAAYDRWRQQGFGRLTEAALVSFFLMEAIDVIKDNPVPIQVHTGLGDADADLRGSDPLLLTPLLSTIGSDVPLVLLHCFPYVAEASYLAATYPNVYMDLSLAMTVVSHRGPDLVLDALQQAPATKLLFATDASRLPEAYYLGARWWRRSLSLALGLLVDDRSISENVALEWAALILAGNARRLYNWPRATDTEAGTVTKADVKTETTTDTAADTGADTGADTESDTDSEVATDTEADTESDTESGASTGAETNTDSEPDADADADGDVEIPAPALTRAPASAAADGDGDGKRGREGTERPARATVVAQRVSAPPAEGVDGRQAGNGPAAKVPSTEAPTGGGPSAGSRPSPSGTPSAPARRRWTRRRRDRSPLPPQPGMGDAGASPGRGAQGEDPRHG